MLILRPSFSPVKSRLQAHSSDPPEPEGHQAATGAAVGKFIECPVVAHGVADVVMADSDEENSPSQTACSLSREVLARRNMIAMEQHGLT